MYRYATAPRIFKVLSNLLEEKLNEYEDLISSIELPKEEKKDIEREVLTGKISVNEGFSAPEFMNAVRVGYRYDIFFMDVGYLKERHTDEGYAKYTRRFVLSPHAAKIFSNTIVENLKLYEKQYGGIIL